MEHCRQSRRGPRAIHRASIAAGFIFPITKHICILLAEPYIKPALLLVNAIAIRQQYCSALRFSQHAQNTHTTPNYSSYHHTTTAISNSSCCRVWWRPQARYPETNFEGVSGWLSPPYRIFRDPVRSTCSRAR